MRKAVKWNTLLYGVEEGVWFVSFHAFDRCLKAALLLRDASLDPMPPVGSKQKDVRYFHIHEDEPFDEARLAGWISQLPANECKMQKGQTAMGKMALKALILAAVALNTATRAVARPARQGAG
ncbi:MAG: hypothetical protein ACXW3K_01740 [Brevundimonas sp.]